MAVSMPASLRTGRLLSSPDRAPGRDPPPRRSERLAAAGGQGRGAVGRRRTWYGQRASRHAVVRPVSRCRGVGGPASRGARGLTRRLLRPRRMRREAVHRSSDPGHWIVTFPWTGAERARSIAEAAFALSGRTSRPGAARRSRPVRRGRSSRRRPSRCARRRRPGSGTPTGGSRSSRSPGRMARARSRADDPHPRSGEAARRDDDLGRRPRQRADGRAGRLDRPGGALQILGRSDLDVAVLETARGGLVLRGMGYESNEVSVHTNVTSDHLDLQGIHTLPELAEVKSTVARVTRADGWCVLNADDPHVARIARRVRGHGVLHAGTGRLGREFAGTRPAAVSYAVDGGWMVELEGKRSTRIELIRVPITIAASPGTTSRTPSRRGRCPRARPVDRGGRRRPGRLPTDLGPRARPAEPVPDRVADRHRRLRPQRGGRRGRARRRRGHAGGAAGRAAPVAIVGTAGDRPDDTLRGIARTRGAGAACRDQGDAAPLPPRSDLRGGRRRDARRRKGSRGEPWRRRSQSETAALRAELANGDGRPRVIVLCHEEREAVSARCSRSSGAKPIDLATELTTLVPRLQERPVRG